MAAQHIAIGRPASVTLATTIREITPLTRGHKPGGHPRKMVVVADVAVTIVTAPEAADGGAVPTSGAITFSATTAAAGFEYDITGYAFLGIAGSGAGTATVELR